MDSWLDELLSGHQELDIQQIGWIEQLIQYSVFEEWKKCELESEMDDLNPNNYPEYAFYLMSNQIDRTDHGLNYNQDDIQKKLAQLK